MFEKFNDDDSINQQKKTFLITREVYKSQEAFFEQQFKPKSICVIPIILPYHIPLEEDIQISGVSSLSGYAYIFMFRNVIETSQFDEELFLLKTILNKTTSTHTYVEMGLVAPDICDLSNEKDYVKFLLMDLNRYLLSIRSNSWNTDIFPVTRQRLNPLSFVSVFNTDNWNLITEFPISLYYSSFNSSVIQNLPLSVNFFIKTSEYTRVNLGNKINPFLISEAFAFDAIKNYNNAVSGSAVVNIGTSIESFIKTLYRLILLTEGMSEQNAMEKVDNAKFKNIIEHQLNSYLNSNWLTTDNSECGNWYRNSYTLRNKIVHEGHDTLLYEARTALDHAMKFKDAIIKKTLSSNDKYSEIIAELNDINAFIPMAITSVIFQSNLIYEKVVNTEKEEQFFNDVKEHRKKWLKLD